jgi:chromosome segregation ATPase
VSTSGAIEKSAMPEGTDENFRAIDARFDGVDSRLDRVDARVDRVDARLEGVDAKLAAHDQRFDAVEAKLAAHDQRFDAVDAKLAAHDRNFEQIARSFEEVFRRFAEQDARNEAQFREILGHFDAVYHRLDRVEQEFLMLKEGVRRIEAMLLDEQGKREELERRLAGLKTDVAALQARIEAIERRLRE